MDNMRAFLDAVKKDHEALQRKEHAAAKRQQTAVQRKGPAVKKAPAARGAKGKAAAIKVRACPRGASWACCNVGPQGASWQPINFGLTRILQDSGATQ